MRILLLGVLAYCIAGVLALALSDFAPGHHLSSKAQRSWRTVGLIFAALAIWRFAQGEQWVLDHIRGWTRLHDYYDSRRYLQVPATIGVITIAMFALLRIGRAPHRQLSDWASVAAFTLLLFSLVRLISLHAVDSLLYRGTGPIHLNGLVDVLLTGGIALLELLDLQRGQRLPKRA